MGRNAAKSACCCDDAARKVDRKEEIVASSVAGGWRPKSIVRRCLAAAEWVVPSAVLALMPKCPLCVAAYVAIGTGVGISTAAAGYLRTFLMLSCAASLSYAVVRRVQRFVGVALASQRTFRIITGVGSTRDA